MEVDRKSNLNLTAENVTAAILVFQDTICSHQKISLDPYANMIAIWLWPRTHTRQDYCHNDIQYKHDHYVKTIFYVLTGRPQSLKEAPGSFIFSLRNKENLLPFKAPLKNQSDGAAIHNWPGFGPVFGQGFDLCISDNAASNVKSYTAFGYTYQPPSGISDSITILAGTNKFTPSQVEVFHIV